MRAHDVLYVCQVSITHAYWTKIISPTTAGAHQITPQRNDKLRITDPGLDVSCTTTPTFVFTSDNAKQIRAKHFPCYAIYLSNRCQRQVCLKCKGESSRALATPPEAIKSIATLDPEVGPPQKQTPDSYPKSEHVPFHWIGPPRGKQSSRGRRH